MSSKEPKRTILGTYMGMEFVESVPHVPPVLRHDRRVATYIFPVGQSPVIGVRFTRDDAGNPVILGPIYQEERMDSAEQVAKQPKMGPVEPPKGLTVGRNCHYVSARKGHLAALVCEVQDRRAGIVTLAVFDHHSRSTHYIDDVYCDPLNHRDGTWHYIEPVVD